MSKLVAPLGLAFFFSLLTLPYLVFLHTAPLPSFHSEWLTGITILGMSTVLLGRGSARIEIPTPALLFVAFSGALALQLSLGLILYPSQGILAIIYLLGAAVLAISTRSLTLPYGRTAIIALFAWAILVGGILNSLIAILQHWNIHSWFDNVITQQANTRAYGNLAQPNHFGNLEALAAVALIHLAAARKIPLGLALPVGCALALGMVLSASRTVWLYLAVIPLLSLLVHKILRTGHSRRLVSGAFLLVAAFVIIQQGLVYLEPAHVTGVQATERLTTIQGNSLQVHLGFMREAWNVFLDAPILGAGYQQFAWQHFIQQATSPNPIFFAYENTFASYAHNLAFQVLAEFGIVGFAILVGLTIWLIIAFRQNPSSEQWLIYAMLAVMLIHSMLEYPLHYLYFLAPFAILLTLASDTSIATVPSRPASITTLLILIVGTVLLAVMFISYRHLEQAYGGTSQRIVMNAATRDHLIQASKGGFFDAEIDHLLNILPAGLGSQEERRLQLQISDRSMRHRPTASRAYRHVFLLAINGNSTEAERYLTMATRAYPGSLADFARQVDTMSAKRPEDQELQDLCSLIDKERGKLTTTLPPNQVENGYAEN